MEEIREVAVILITKVKLLLEREAVWRPIDIIYREILQGSSQRGEEKGK